VNQIYGLINDAANNLYLNLAYTAPFSSALIDFTNSATTTNTLSLALPSTATSMGTWALTGSLNMPRVSHTICKMQDGRVLLAGGYTGSSAAFTTSTEIFDPKYSTWATTGAMNTTRMEFAMILLNNGQVLAIGGQDSNGNNLSACELYNPVTGTWTTTGSMNTGRDQYQAIALTNGNVLVAGGLNPSLTTVATCEIYNIGTGLWTTTGSMNYARNRFVIAKTCSGNVFVSGGQDDSLTAVLTSEIYNPNTETWTVTGNMNGTMGNVSSNSAFFQNGNVYIYGGYPVGNSTSSVNIGTTIYNTLTGNIRTAPRITASAMAGSKAVMLESGQILTAGAPSSTNSYLYNPVTQVWSSTGSLASVQFSDRDNLANNMCLLNDGRVLIAGGFTVNPIATCEIYVPIRANNALIKWAANGQASAFQTLPGTTSYPTITIGNNLLVDDTGSVSVITTNGSNTTLYNMNTTSTSNTLSRATLGSINAYGSMMPISSNWIKWTNNLVNLDPYTYDFIVNLPTPNTAMVKTVVPVTLNYNYKAVSNSYQGNFVINSNTVAFDSIRSTWYNY
jgi:hypothetical protein